MHHLEMQILYLKNAVSQGICEIFAVTTSSFGWLREQDAPHTAEKA